MKSKYGEQMLQKLKKMKKEQWIVIFLVGVLLLIVAIPTTPKTQEKDTVRQEEEKEKKEPRDVETYTRELEQRTEKILSSMEGVGQVQVMITLKDDGSCVVEKDVTTNNTEDNQDSGEGVTSQAKADSYSEVTVYNSQSDGDPMVVSERYPQVEGVVVAAEGGGSSTVVQNILDALEALFPVEIHKIKVVKKTGGK